MSVPKVCSNCHVHETPLWRKHWDKNTQRATLLCNACGIYQITHGVERPVPLIEGARLREERQQAQQRQRAERDAAQQPPANASGQGSNAVRAVSQALIQSRLTMQNGGAATPSLPTPGAFIKMQRKPSAKEMTKDKLGGADDKDAKDAASIMMMLLNAQHQPTPSHDVDASKAHVSAPAAPAAPASASRFESGPAPAPCTEAGASDARTDGTDDPVAFSPSLASIPRRPRSTLPPPPQPAPPDADAQASDEPTSKPSLPSIPPAAPSQHAPEAGTAAEHTQRGSRGKRKHSQGGGGEPQSSPVPSKRSRRRAVKLEEARADDGVPAPEDDAARPNQTCANCGTSETPMWRKERRLGTLLCNKCGIYLRTHGTMRPVDGFGRRAKADKSKAGSSEVAAFAETGSCLSAAAPDGSAAPDSSAKLGALVPGSTVQNFLQGHRRQGHAAGMQGVRNGTPTEQACPPEMAMASMMGMLIAPQIYMAQHHLGMAGMIAPGLRAIVTDMATMTGLGIGITSMAANGMGLATVAGMPTPPAFGGAYQGSTQLQGVHGKGGAAFMLPSLPECQAPLRPDA